MKKIRFTFAIYMVILFFGCSNHSKKIVINLELIKKFDSISEKSHPYNIDLSILMDNDFISLYRLDGEKIKTLYLNNDGSFDQISLYDKEFGKKVIKDIDDEIAKNIINDFKKIIEQTIIFDKRIKRVDKILCQDFLNKDLISTLETNLFCHKNLYSTNFFSKEYYGMHVAIDESINLAKFEYYYNNNSYVMMMDHTLTNNVRFFKNFGSKKECFICSTLFEKDGQEAGTHLISESDLQFFEKEVTFFKNIITEKISKLKGQEL